MATGGLLYQQICATGINLRNVRRQQFLEITHCNFHKFKLLKGKFFALKLIFPSPAIFHPWQTCLIHDRSELSPPVEIMTDSVDSNVKMFQDE